METKELMRVKTKDNPTESMNLHCPVDCNQQMSYTPLQTVDA